MYGSRIKIVASICQDMQPSMRSTHDTMWNNLMIIFSLVLSPRRQGVIISPNNTKPIRNYYSIMLNMTMWNWNNFIHEDVACEIVHNHMKCLSEMFSIPRKKCHWLCCFLVFSWTSRIQDVNFRNLLYFVFSWQIYDKKVAQREYVDKLFCILHVASHRWKHSLLNLFHKIQS